MEPKIAHKKISIPNVTRKGVQHNQLSATNYLQTIICSQPIICNQLSATNYLQNLLQILVNGEPAEKIPPGQNVTKQKQPELYNRG